jgi:hypothetical protein
LGTFAWSWQLQLVLRSRRYGSSWCNAWLVKHTDNFTF